MSAEGTMGRTRAIPQRRRWLRAVAAGSIGCAVGVILGEAVCRATWGAPLAEREPLMEVRAHPTRGFAMIPNTVHYTYAEEVRVNALGLRGPEHLDAKDDDARVLVLGDSLVFGQGVGEEETLPRGIERALGARGEGDRRRARVWNAGVRSYNTEQELALLEELLQRVRPTVVVLGWFANDLDRVEVSAMNARLERSGPIVFDWNAPASDEVRSAWNLRQLARSSALVMKMHDLWVDLRWPTVLASDLAAAWERNDAALDRLGALSREHGFDVLVVALPLAGLVADDYALDATTPRLGAACEGRGLPVLDLLPVLRAERRANGRLRVLPYDGHYDGAANAAMGEKIAEELEELFPRRFRR